MNRLKIALIYLTLSVIACTEPVKIKTQTADAEPTRAIVHPMPPDPGNLTAIECEPCE